MECKRDKTVSIYNAKVKKPQNLLIGHRCRIDVADLRRASWFALLPLPVRPTAALSTFPCPWLLQIVATQFNEVASAQLRIAPHCIEGPTASRQLEALSWARLLPKASKASQIRF